MIKYHRQEYTCENGGIARFVIPEDATEQDLRTIKKIADLYIERIKEEKNKNENK